MEGGFSCFHVQFMLPWTIQTIKSPHRPATRTDVLAFDDRPRVGVVAATVRQTTNRVKACQLLIELQGSPSTVELSLVDRHGATS
jgi:hypothetical protein